MIMALKCHGVSRSAQLDVIPEPVAPSNAHPVFHRLVLVGIGNAFNTDDGGFGGDVKEGCGFILYNAGPQIFICPDDGGIIFFIIDGIKKLPGDIDIVKADEYGLGQVKMFHHQRGLFKKADSFDVQHFFINVQRKGLAYLFRGRDDLGAQNFGGRDRVLSAVFGAVPENRIKLFRKSGPAT